MTPPHLKYLAPPSVARTIWVKTFRVAVFGGILFALLHLWRLGAYIYWGLILIATISEFYGAIGQPRYLRLAAKSPEERAIAEAHIAATRYPFYPVMIGYEFLCMLLVAFWLL